MCAFYSHMKSTDVAKGLLNINYTFRSIVYFFFLFASHFLSKKYLYIANLEITLQVLSNNSNPGIIKSDTLRNLIDFSL